MWTRRFFLQSAALAFARAAEPQDRKLFLFLDWFHVSKGMLDPVLDSSRMSEAGKELQKSLARDFGRVFNVGEHGFRRKDLAFGVRVTPEDATKSERWLTADRPWEQNTGYGCVIQDGGKYRCWYNARLRKEKLSMSMQGGQAMELKGSAFGYAESTDGFTWTKPILKVLGENNLVSPYANGGCVFLDPHGAPAERYKTFYFDRLPGEGKPQHGLYGASSPDGLRWTKGTKPLVRYFSDTQNVGAWDAALGRYVGYFRHHFSGRTISRAETGDFWNWPQPEPLLHAGPLDGSADDYYFNGFTLYPGDPSLRLLFVSIYHRNRDDVDVRLAVSRDGRVYNWLSYDPVIRLGANGSWDGGTVYACPNLVRLPDGSLGLPYSGSSNVHNEAWFKNHYTSYPTESGLAWAKWQDARLAGIEAADYGEFTTNAAKFSGGGIEINARTSRAGSVLVELREGGKPLEGFTFENAVAFSGDRVWEPLRWKDRNSLAALQGKSISISFRLSSAKVFAARFV